MKESPADPIISDTGQIIKNIARQQLTVAAPKAEAFSGQLDSAAPAALKHLALAGQGFATVILVSNDDQPIATSEHLILSRTALDKASHDTAATVVSLRGLNADANRQWYFHLTRPRSDRDRVKDEPLNLSADGTVSLPAIDWHECELTLR
jgi:hypothetical protein